MESSKRSLYEVDGYIHDVSDVLVSRSGSYFTALLQEAGKTTRVVVFDVQKHNVFQCAERDRSPVKLTTVGFSPSRQVKNTNDVTVNSRTRISVARQLSYVFEENLCATTPFLTLEEIIKDTREYQRVSVKVKIVRAFESKDSVVRGQRMSLQNVIVADVDHLMLLAVWGVNDLQVGKWYNAFNLSVRLFKNNMSLSTTAQTTMEKLEDCGPTKDFDESEIKTVNGEILEADVKVEHYCPKHHVLENVNLGTLMTRCSKCSSYCKTSKITVEIRGHVGVSMEGQQEKFIFCVVVFFFFFLRRVLMHHFIFSLLKINPCNFYCRRF
ncbi:uncharacterized protein LOC113649567 isoform X2 [Tachysurus fulvidraco]|nr:uncharacterized protein LOC113649567 isoform X2 [Tachysurus fulvidraco]